MKEYQEYSFKIQYPLSKKKPLKKTIAAISNLLGIMFLISIFFIVQSMSRQSNGAAFGVIPTVFTGLVIFTLVTAIIIYFYQRWYYKTYFYNVTDEYIIIRKGSLAPHEITVPHKQIQDIYVDQDLLDRLFGLYDVHISSATAASGAAAHIDGVDKETAEKLREIILTHVREKIRK